jgi:hypothetical protein
MEEEALERVLGSFTKKWENREREREREREILRKEKGRERKRERERERERRERERKERERERDDCSCCIHSGSDGWMHFLAPGGRVDRQAMILFILLHFSSASLSLFALILLLSPVDAPLQTNPLELHTIG